jgi:hypothetical protein
MNSPPDATKRKRPGGSERFVESELQTSAHATTYRVVVDGKRDGMPWRAHANRLSAEAEAAQLRKLGMAARVEPIEPEFGTSRRAFLIAMFMSGAVKPERIVERVVSEVGQEAQP